MASDAPLLDRLARLPAVPIAELVELLERMPDLARDPLFAGLAGKATDQRFVISVSWGAPKSMPHSNLSSSFFSGSVSFS